MKKIANFIIIAGFLGAGFAYGSGFAYNDCPEFNTKERIDGFTSSIKKAFRDDFIVRRIPNYTQFYQLRFGIYFPEFVAWYITADTLRDKLYNLETKSYVIGVVNNTKIKTITLKNAETKGSSWDPENICTYEVVFENAYPSTVEFTMTNKLPESTR
ncbi:MAG TPA: hypothetical protein VEL47_04560 [Myxococcota bacterium]|nr:hypothetical protein [Myxococcota bacterium]